MKKFLLSFLAIFFPGIIFVLEGRLEFAVFAFAMQASVIGWIPISVVAWRHREAFGVYSKKAKKTTSSSSDDAVENEASEEKPVEEQPGQDVLHQEKSDEKE
jgi:membrane protein implicated in regulation of membrane protease activity